MQYSFFRGTPGIVSKSRAGKWRLKEVTPGLIAFAATTLVYLISGDSQFVTKNDHKNTTTYDYMAFFQKYEALLIRTRELPNTKMLFQWLNHEIFGSSFGSSPIPARPSAMIQTAIMLRCLTIRRLRRCLGLFPPLTSHLPQLHMSTLF
ncbi:hypothetical protein BDY19DRAFT_342966 [Irpex rosettiformis]|uniref:Uncharacterized protein n=1 Tax=Irpex rosettiformis TaxID=378272 RepID=A0ACB8TXJ9_9APHY|nr:hypothetical protein BDY19DRAFT_342966 [Irpex rosettiformis]